MSGAIHYRSSDRINNIPVGETVVENGNTIQGPLPVKVVDDPSTSVNDSIATLVQSMTQPELMAAVLIELRALNHQIREVFESADSLDSVRTDEAMAVSQAFLS